MSSGVKVSDAAKTSFEEIKQKKTNRYIIYHIKDEKEIDVESVGPREAKYSDLLDQLQKLKTECRYCVFDFPSISKTEAGDSYVDRLVLMSWCPDEAKIKQKMLYSASFDALKKSLVGVYKYVQGCAFDEITEQTIVEKCRR